MSKNNESEQLSLNKKPNLLSNFIRRNTNAKAVPIEIPMMDHNKVGHDEDMIQSLNESLEQPIKVPTHTMSPHKKDQEMTNNINKSNDEPKHTAHDKMKDIQEKESKAVQLPSFDDQIDNEEIDTIASMDSVADNSLEIEKKDNQLATSTEQTENITENKVTDQPKESVTETQAKQGETANETLDQVANAVIPSADETSNKETIIPSPTHSHLTEKDRLQTEAQPTYDMERLSRQHHHFLQKLNKHQKKIDTLLEEANQLYNKRNQLVQKLTLNDENNVLNKQLEKQKSASSVSIENKLYHSKLDVQGVGCDLVVQYAEKIRENIYNNSSEAKRLLAPLQTSCELLQTKVEYVSCLEEAVAAIAEHKDLKRQENRIQSALNFLKDCLKDFEPTH
ncbi:MAG TPA: hypothetical protein ENK78_05445 [Thiothrix sp.]|nr:hypothetical protein [Thiothrix sp.]